MNKRNVSSYVIKKFFIALVVTTPFFFLTHSAFATDNSPTQANYLHLTKDGFVGSTEPNGKQFDSGFSFSGWFYFKKLPEPDERVSIAGYSWDSFILEVVKEGDLNFWLMENNLNIQDPPMNRWLNLAVTLDGRTAKFFMDGQLVRETTVGSDVIVFPDSEYDSFFLGGYWGYAKQFKIWDRALNDSEVRQQISHFNSSASDPLYQWLLDEGVGNVMADTGRNRNVNLSDPRGYVFWANIHSPYEVIADTHLENREIVPFVHVWGVADFDQDGRKEAFVHGTDDIYVPDKEAMLILRVGEDNNLTDVSSELIDGGLYEKNMPHGRETVIGDLNGDGFDDIFYVNGAGHHEVIKPELPSLLLSDGKSGKLFPSEHTIKSPPCTLSAPAFEGQKPCQMNDDGVVYPDPDAPLVALDNRATGHGGTSGDIDGDGDIDLLNVVQLGGERNHKPVAPYFLINDGQGEFTANWQMVPFKMFNYWFEFLTLPDGNWDSQDTEYPIAHLDDYDGDGYLDLALISAISEAQKQLPPETPFSVETERAWVSIYSLIAWGDAGGFSEEYSILYHEPLPHPQFTGPNTAVLSMDIEGDGDLDLIIGRDGEESGHYIQILRNEGGRVFKDKTSELIPQTVEEILGRGYVRGFQESDFNNDGCPDFALVVPAEVVEISNRASSPHRLWLNDCTGKFTPIRDSYVGKMGQLLSLDIDQDGGRDFVSFAYGDYFGPYITATVLKQTGEGNLQYFVDSDGNGIVNANEIDSLNGIAGLWYDPSLDGEGFNIISTPSGLVVFYYGYTKEGEQLWLISETFQGEFGFEEFNDLLMYEGVGGTFAVPAASPEGLAEWGRLNMLFGDCGTAQFDIQGADGVKTSYGVKLAGITDADCQKDQLAAPSGLAGLWFDASLDGEGYNIIITNTSTVFFFYGYDMEGNRLWLLSETLSGAPQVGEPVTLTMYSASGGTFDVPRPSSESLSVWGDLEVTFNSCTDGIATLVGADGEKTSSLVKLAGVTGSICP